MKTAIYLLIATVALPSFSFGMTGAELLQADRNFASGYVLGVVDARTGIYIENDPNQIQLRECITNAKLTSSTLYDVVADYLRRNPKDLPAPAMGAVVKVLNEMCL
jgi:hypothetical protein